MVQQKANHNIMATFNLHDQPVLDCRKHTRKHPGAGPDIVPRTNIG